MKRILFFSVFIAIAALLFKNNADSFEYSGKVVNDIGRPAVNANITVEEIASPNNTMTAVTDTSGRFTFTITDLPEKDHQSPFSLYGNFPNPFNPYTRISYSVDEASDITITIINIFGQTVRTINHGYREAGFYTAIWDGRDEAGKICPSGIYFYKLDVGERSLMSKMLMVDASTGSWISRERVPVEIFKESVDDLYIVTVTHSDAETFVLGPMTIKATADTILTINRIMNKMQLISHNTYMRGTKWYSHSRIVHKVIITKDYLMDKYEVTAGLFSNVMTHALVRGAIYVDSLNVKNSEGDTQVLFKLDTPENPTNMCVKYEDGSFIPKEGCEKYPVTFVSWYGAVFFCYERNIIEGLPQTIDISDWIFDFKSTGYRLPTDAEWELAAAWTDRREYAFGSDPGYYKPMNVQLNPDDFDDILSPVGWFSPQGDSHDGMCDLSGNVYEWVWDWFHYYKPSWKDSTLVDPTGPQKGANKIARGGSAYGCFRAARTADKANLPIGLTSMGIGFRTVRLLKD